MPKPWEVAGQTPPSQSTPWQQAAVNADRRAAAPAAARAAFEASHNSPEQVRRRELDSRGPVGRYMGEWGDALRGAFGGPMVSDKGIAHDLLQGLAGTGETALSLGTGLTSLVTEPLEEIFTGRDVKRGDHVYQPRTEGGQAQAQAIGAVAKPVGDYFSESVPTGLQAGAEGIGIPEDIAREIGEGGARVLEAATIGTPAKLRGGKPPVIAPGAEGVQAGRAATGVVNETLPKPATEPQQVARAAGISVLPSSVPKMPGAKGKVLERVSGSPQAAVNFSIKNEPRLQAHARTELGLKGEAKLTPQELQQAKQPHLAVYDEVLDTVPTLVRDQALDTALDAIGAGRRNNALLEVAPSVEKLRERLAHPDATGALPTKDVMEAVRDWRFKARKLYNSADDPAKHEQAQAYQAAADAFEDAVERAANAAGKGDLGQRFKQARQGLAKVFDVEESLVDGMVDVGAFSRMQKGGKKLSGRLQMLADIGRWFERETRPTSGLSMPEHQSVPLLRIMMSRALQAAARAPIDDILANEFGRVQRQFGDVDPAPGPGSPLGAYFDAPPQRPQPAPQGPFGSGSVDFSGSPEVPPSAALRNEPRPGSREFARDESGDASIPPAEASLGDLTASEVPPIEGIPFEASPEIMNVQGPRAPAPIGNDIAGSGGGFFPGAEVPPNAALVEWLTDQPLERRREGGRPLVEEPNPPFQGNSNRPFPDDGNPPTAPGRPGDPEPLEFAEEYPLPDRSAERDRVLRGEAFSADAMLGDLFARFPQLRDQAWADTQANAQTLMRRVEDRGGQRPPRDPGTPRRRKDDPDADDNEGPPVAPAPVTPPKKPLFDPAGEGAVPDNRNVDYLGFTRIMTPDEFLGLAQRIPPGQERVKALAHLRALAESGGQFGNPALWGAKWDPAAKVWRVRGTHEGRHRTMVARERGEREIPVHVFPGEGMRARDLTDEMRSAPVVFGDHAPGSLAARLGDDFAQTAQESIDTLRRGDDLLAQGDELMRQMNGPVRVPDSPDPGVQRTIEELRDLGWDEPEIAELLKLGG